MRRTGAVLPPLIFSSLSVRRSVSCVLFLILPPASWLGAASFLVQFLVVLLICFDRERWDSRSVSRAAREGSSPHVS